MENKIHTKEDQSLIANKLGELMALCVNLNGEHFTCFIEYMGNVQEWKITAHKDGWHTSKHREIQEGYYVSPDWSSAESSIENINDIMSELKILKSDSEKNWSIENQEAAKAEIKSKRLKAARETLAKLEGESND